MRVVKDLFGSFYDDVEGIETNHYPDQISKSVTGEAEFIVYIVSGYKSNRLNILMVK